MKKIFSLLVAILILTSSQAQKTVLSFNLEKGKKYKLVSNSKSVINQDLYGQKINMEVTINGTMLFFVKDIKDDNYEMEVEYESLGMTMQMPQGSVEFSSEKHDEQDVFSTILAAMKNSPFNMKMSKTGKVLEVKNIEVLFDSIINRVSRFSPEQVAQMKQQLMKAYGPEAFKGNIEMVTAIYPEKPVGIGDSWEIKTKLKSSITANVTSTYSFVKDSADYYLIAGDSKIETKSGKVYKKSGGIFVKYDIDGKMISGIKVDKESGWIKEANVKQNMEGEVFFKADSTMKDAMKIPMVIENNMTVKGE